MSEDRPTGVCRHCGEAIELYDPIISMWRHVENGSDTCEIYAEPVA